MRAGTFISNTPAELLSFKNYRNGWIARGLHMLGSTQMATAAGDYLESEMVQAFGAVVTEPWEPWRQGHGLGHNLFCGQGIPVPGSQ